MRKELRPVHDLVSCDLCQRTILKGERIETFVGGGDRQRVCELCSLRALRSGWMRESELERQVPDREHRPARASLWSRAVAWAEEQGIWSVPPPGDAEEDGASLPPQAVPAATARHVPEAPPAATTEQAPEPSSEPDSEPEPASPARAPRDAAVPVEDEVRAALEERRRRAAARAEERRQARRLQAEAADQDSAEASGDNAASMARRPNGAGLRDLISGRRREPREAPAVPSGRWAKIERALELFNRSEHRRTMAGVGRTLGEPLVCAAPLEDGPAAREVGITVAWELSWYRFEIDIDDVEPGVALVDRGNELDDLAESLRAWNVEADGEGRLALAIEAVS